MKRLRYLTILLGFLFLNIYFTSAQEKASLAVIYYWKAKPEKLEEYNRYIQEVAEPIDEEARRQGAFVSVTTFLAQPQDTLWTHMRIFMLNDSTQFTNLVPALNAAGALLEPDEARRNARAEYAATLRDLIGQQVVSILR